MAPSSDRGGQDGGIFRVKAMAAKPSGAAEQPGSEAPCTTELLKQLSADRLWLLQRIDGGQWPELRLDLAALERELGQLLDLASERIQPD